MHGFFVLSFSYYNYSSTFFQPVDKEKPYADDASLKEVKFQPTPVMSTYLTAVVVGQYDCVQDVTSNGVPVRVFTPVGKKETGRFALEVNNQYLVFGYIKTLS